MTTTMTITCMFCVSQAAVALEPLRVFVRAMENPTNNDHGLPPTEVAVNCLRACTELFFYFIGFRIFSICVVSKFLDCFEYWFCWDDCYSCCLPFAMLL